MKGLFLAALMAATATAAGAEVINLPAHYTLPPACTATSATTALLGFDSNDNLQGTVTVAGTCIVHGAHNTVTHRPFTQTSPITWDFNGAYTGSYTAPLAVPAADPGLAVDGLGNVAEVAGGAVTLTVNNAPVIVPVAAIVPNVVGLPLAAAEGSLSDWRLTYLVTVNYSYAAPVGSVFNQNPTAGTVVPFGTTVIVWERLNHTD